ncbi:MAG: 3-oxoacyl-ACP synthase [Bacteroidetes bacterium 4572_117]|nr:MAG: 3-oxoacyl-ACP synthase [Bacteroidetes bacterium 4572_117]
MYNSKIVGAGHYVPEKIVTNKDLEKIMDTSDEWIRERSGIEERRFAEMGVDTTANMGTKSAKIALERAGLTADDVDFIVFATLSPDYYFPGPGVTVQHELGCKRTVGALDVRNQCSGFIYSLSVADQFIKTGMYKTILVIGSELQSSGLDLTTRGRGVSVLFGDGAGAVVLQRTEEENKGILSTHMHSEGQFAELLCVKSPGNHTKEKFYKDMHEDYKNTSPQMDGQAVFKNAVVRFSQVIMEALKANNCAPADLDMFVPHQANLRITQFVQRKLQLPDNKVYSNIQKFGNTTAATIPIILSELWEKKGIKENDLFVLAAFGSGFTWASALIRW